MGGWLRLPVPARGLYGAKWRARNEPRKHPWWITMEGNSLKLSGHSAQPRMEMSFALAHGGPPRPISLTPTNTYAALWGHLLSLPILWRGPAPRASLRGRVDGATRRDRRKKRRAGETSWANYRDLTCASQARDCNYTKYIRRGGEKEARWLYAK